MFCFLEYFRHHPHIGLTYEPSRDGEHENDDIIAMSDASWETVGPRPGGSSSCGRPPFTGAASSIPPFTLSQSSLV